MGFLIQVSFLVLLGLCGTAVCCGALVILCRLPLLVERQRATLWGVER